MPDLPEFPAELLVADPGAITSHGLPIAADHPASESWEIAAVDVAAWAVAKMTDAAESARRVHDMAVEWRRRITEWEADAARPFEATVQFMDERLRAYGLRERAASPRDRHGEPTVKSIVLPNGRIQTRKGGTQIAVTNEAELLAWLETNLADAVKTTKSARIDVLKAATDVYCEENAEWCKVMLGDEVVPGVIYVPTPDTARVDPA